MATTVTTPPTEEFDYGTGTNTALEALEGFIRSKQKVDTILVNIATLLRNRSRKEVTSEQIRQETLQDLQHLIQVVAGSLDLSGAYLLLYMADYQTVAPKILLRDAVPSRVPYYTAHGAMRKDLQKGVPPITKMGSVKVEWLLLRPIVHSYSELSIRVHNQHNTHSVAMISHIATDFHLSRLIPFFMLVHSFTGNMWTTEDLGKLVFGLDDVPFTLHTHALLGDKETFKSVLGIAKKRELEEIAKKEQWLYHTPAFIKQQLLQYGFFERGVTYPIVGRM